VINKQTVEIKCYLYLVLLFDIYAPVFIMDENSLPVLLLEQRPMLFYLVCSRYNVLDFGKMV